MSLCVLADSFQLAMFRVLGLFNHLIIMFSFITSDVSKWPVRSYAIKNYSDSN